MIRLEFTSQYQFELLTNESLVCKYESLVRNVAWSIKRTVSRDIELQDLVSYGYIGLIEAKERYIVDNEVAFAVFARYRIRGAIYDGLRSMGWLKRHNYKRLKMGLKKEETTNELSQKSLHTFEMVFYTNTELESKLIYANNSEFGVEDNCRKHQIRTVLLKAIECLPVQERKLVRLYYYEECSLEKAGQSLGLSKSWMSRVHKRAIKRLGKRLGDLVIEM